MKKFLLVLLMILSISACKKEKVWEEPIYNTYYKECIFGKVMIVHSRNTNSGITLDLDSNGRPIPCHVGDLITERLDK